MTAERRSRAETPLSRDRIVQTALGIVDRDGLDALSMRRLGAELGVDPMAIYYHVPNKDALLDAIVEAVMSEIDLTFDDASLPTEDPVVGAARAYLDAMLAHVNALPIVLSRGPSTPVALRPVELLIRILRDARAAAQQRHGRHECDRGRGPGIVAMVARTTGRRRPRPRTRRPRPTASLPTSSRTYASPSCARRLPARGLRVRRASARSRASRQRRGQGVARAAPRRAGSRGPAVGRASGYCRPDHHRHHAGQRAA